MRSLESEFGESTNAIRLELNKFENAGMINSEFVGNKKFYTANTSHPLFQDIHKIVLKYIGLDKIIEGVVGKIGDLESVYLVGDYARGLDNGIIDLVFLGTDIDSGYLTKLNAQAEKLINRKIRYLVYSGNVEMKNGYQNIDPRESLLLWKQG